jgi:hypothetical protein
MKYILLIRNNADFQESLAERERDAIMADVDKIMAELTETGEFLGGQALAPASKTVRVRDGVPMTIDGPFAEAKEQLAGYLIVDVETEQRALEIAARWPDARFGAMEVRPIIDQVGTEM